MLNYVGYDQVGLPDGGNAMGVGNMFLRVGDETTTLGDLKITGYNKAQGAGGVLYCQLLDGAGRSKGIDYWWYEDGVKGDGDEAVDWWYGWYDANAEIPYNDVELLPGDGVWIFSTSTDFKVQGAGEVPPGPVQIALPNGGNAKLVINPMPCDLTFGDMWIDGYSKEQGAGGVLYCQLLDGAGRSKGTDYWWYDDGVKGDGDEAVDWWYGWYDANAEIPYNSLPLPAGTGVWMFSTSTDFTANFKSPIQKDVE